MDITLYLSIKPKDIVYQHRLIGLSDNWSEQSANNEVTFAGLNPGEYRFEVRSSIDQINWTPIKTFGFIINKPFWKTIWFIVGSVFIVIMIVIAIVSLRIRQVKAKAQKREDDLNLEKELLELEQKALRLQMNPHFIFNALNSIQAMISGNDPKTARYYLAKFSKLMRQVLDNSRQSQISLDREIETLENYLSIEKSCHNDRFDYQIEVSSDIDIDNVFIPPIIIQPFVENSIIHGVSQLASNGMINIKLTIESAILTCTIRDNGIGRKAARQVKSQEDQKHKSSALIITQERLDKLNSSLELPSIEIEDLFDNGEAIGTEVKLRFILSTD